MAAYGNKTLHFIKHVVYIINTRHVHFCVCCKCRHKLCSVCSQWVHIFLSDYFCLLVANFCFVLTVLYLGSHGWPLVRHFMNWLPLLTITWLPNCKGISDITMYSMIGWINCCSSPASARRSKDKQPLVC